MAASARSPLSYAEAILKGLGSLTAAESSEILLGPLPTAAVCNADIRRSSFHMRNGEPGFGDGSSSDNSQLKSDPTDDLSAELVGPRLRENYRLSEIFTREAAIQEYKMATTTTDKRHEINTTCFSQTLASPMASTSLTTERDRPSTHILIAMATEGGSSAEDNKRIICENLDDGELRVSKLRLRSNGKIMIETLTAKDKDDIYKALLSNKVIRKKFVITVAKKRKPYFIILNVNPELDIRGVKRALIHQNDAFTDANVTVKFALPGGRRGTNWVIAVDPSLFPVLDKAKGVYLGWRWLRASEYINVWQCFNCGKFGHTTKECTGERICLECGGSKHEGGCKEKCINCTFSNQFHCTRHDTRHSCIDRKCPNYIRQMGFVVRETDYGNQL